MAGSAVACTRALCGTECRYAVRCSTKCFETSQTERTMTVRLNSGFLLLIVKLSDRLSNQPDRSSCSLSLFDGLLAFYKDSMYVACIPNGFTSEFFLLFLKSQFFTSVGNVIQQNTKSVA